MATLIVKLKHGAWARLRPHAERIRLALEAATATALSIEPRAVVVAFETWDDPEPQNAPDVMVRAESNTRRRPLLQAWAAALARAARDAVSAAEMPDARVAVKAYLIESEWVEA